MATEVYRLRLARTSGAASWGDVDYFEDRERFQARLFDAMLQAEVHDARRMDLRTRLLSVWQNRPGTDRDEPVKITRVIAAEKLVDGEWVDLEPVLIPPGLTFKEI